jgi:transmembrane sensor
MTDQPLPPLDPSSPDWDALARHLAGEGSEAERADVRRMIEEKPARGAVIELLAQVGRAPEPVAPTAAEVEAALAGVRARAVQDTRTEPTQRSAPVTSLNEYRSRWRHARVAAAAAVLVVAGASLVWRIGSKTAPVTTAPTNYATAAGAIDSVTLSDGSRVLLGPGSQLAIAPGFGSKVREMTLVGEARFTVVHDASRPFIIHTATATVRDIGTVFSVHSDGVDGVRVVVTEGAVDVQERSGASHETLAAGDIAVVATGGGIQVQRASASADDLAWTQGRLVFRDASVAQVSVDLRRWYGVEVKVDSSLSRRPVTASFDRGLSAADVAKIVAATIGGTLREEAGVFHITSARAGSPAK